MKCYSYLTAVVLALNLSTWAHADMIQALVAGRLAQYGFSQQNNQPKPVEPIRNDQLLKHAHEITLPQENSLKLPSVEILHERLQLAEFDHFAEHTHISEKLGGKTMTEWDIAHHVHDTVEDYIKKMGNNPECAIQTKMREEDLVNAILEDASLQETNKVFSKLAFLNEADATLQELHAQEIDKPEIFNTKNVPSQLNNQQAPALLNVAETSLYKLFQKETTKTLPPIPQLPFQQPFLNYQPVQLQKPDFDKYPAYQGWQKNLIFDDPWFKFWN